MSKEKTATPKRLELNIAILGDEKAGKSALVVQFCQRLFQANYEVSAIM
jgi:GTPase SAR1 family protein